MHEKTMRAIDYLTKNGLASYNSVHTLANGLDALTTVCNSLANLSGWWTAKDGTPIDPHDPNVFGCKMALVHSEVSEALEGGRKKKMDDHLPHRPAVEVELADALIRIHDYAGQAGLDLRGAVLEKLAYNQQRADHRPENRYAPGGKSF